MSQNETEFRQTDITGYNCILSRSDPVHVLIQRELKLLSVDCPYLHINTSQ